MASVEGTGAVYEDGRSLVGGVPSYGLRYGATERVELGARFSPLSLEANVKIGLVRNEWFALALAPRVTSTSGIALLTLTQSFPATYARVPVLATLQITEWSTLTPRAGIGFVAGRAWAWDRSSRGYDLHDPVVEVGGTLLFRLAPTVSLGLDGYAISTILDSQVLTGGGGVAVLFTPRQETQR
ncbi:MAG: hypothetical protein EOP08_08150 [Proteobacteria bacterium]|nr:MAG: hypothetical protein EOP08_08150 [Pseudomonadota bacterium]